MMDMREVVLQTIFLDIQNAYDALEWDRFLDILVEYCLGSRMLQILWKYWDLLHMLENSGGYFYPPFKGYRGVNQGNHLSPTIFNVVMDAVIWHWVMVVAPTEAGAEVPRETI